MRLPTKRDLRSTFNEVAGSSYNNVPGVIRLTAGSPTKKVILSAMTHGDEPSGLGAFRFLLENREILRDVELILAIHNIDGGAQWFKSKTRNQKHACRTHGWNFNRLPLGFPEGAGGPSALQRVRQLWRRVYPDTQYGLDMHSAQQPLSKDGLIIDIAGDKKLLDRISDAIPATARFQGITPLQEKEGSRTRPIGVVFGGPGKSAVALEVESDSHESRDGIRIAVQTTLSFLIELDCINAEISERRGYQDIYKVLGAVMVESEGYEFVDDKILKSFAPIARGQILLNGPGHPVRATCKKGCLIFAPSKRRLQPGDEKEEVAFELSTPKKRRRIIKLPNWFPYLSKGIRSDL